MCDTLSTNNTKGADNTHEILKEAQTDDSAGMVKYSIDLDDDMEKQAKSTSRKLSKQEENTSDRK